MAIVAGKNALRRNVRKKMSEFGKTLFGGSKFIFWTVAPFIVLFLVVMTVLIPVLNTKLSLWMWILPTWAWVTGISLVIGMWNPTRFSWTFRIVTAMVLILYLGYAFYELKEHHWKLVRPHSIDDSNPVNALLGLVIIGIPCLIYTVFGRFTFRKVEGWSEKTFGPLGKNIDEILSHEDSEPIQTILGAIDYRINQKIDTNGKANLTDTEKKFIAICWLQGEVNNGGFDQYFFNSAGNDAEIALAGLRDIGAFKARELLEQAMAVFPGGKSPADRFKRQEEMVKIRNQSELVWEKCDREFFKLPELLSLTYVKQNKAEFRFP